MYPSGLCFQENGCHVPLFLLMGQDGDEQSGLGSQMLKMTESLAELPQ